MNIVYGLKTYTISIGLKMEVLTILTYFILIIFYLIILIIIMNYLFLKIDISLKSFL